MEKMNRRSFCGASVLALPIMSALAKEKRVDELLNPSDPVLDALADEFTRTTLSGTRNGFGAGHFRQYAGQVRLFNAHLESKGTVKKLNRQLDEDDYDLLNPDRTVAVASEYWKTRGVLFDKDRLYDLVSMDGNSYRALKKAIKEVGGFRKLHERIAEAFEQRADQYATTALKSRLIIQDGSVKFPAFQGPGRKTNFVQAQYNPEFDPDVSIDPLMFVGLNLDCLCKAMTVEGALLSILCVTVCPPCCVPAALMLAFATLMESTGACKPENC